MAETENSVEQPDIVEVDKKVIEKDEDELFRMRAKLFRWAKEADPAEWKERGTGDVCILRHKINKRIRLVMRREKTYKTCANHYVEPTMKLKAHCGSERAWVWTVPTDYADEEPKEELLAIRFLNSEIANKFKAKFEECQEEMTVLLKKESQDRVVEKLTQLAVSSEQEECASSEQAASDVGAGGEKEETGTAEKTAGEGAASTTQTSDSPPSAKVEDKCAGESGRVEAEETPTEGGETATKTAADTSQQQQNKEDVPEK